MLFFIPVTTLYERYVVTPIVFAVGVRFEYRD